MKKYILFSTFFVLSLFLIGFSNVKLVSADDSASSSDSSIVSGCGFGPYSTITGQLCSATVTAPVACASGDLYSYITGQPCSNTTAVTTPRTSEDGATSSSVSEDSNLNVGSKGDAVKKLQQELEDNGFSLGGVDGIYGPMTFSAVEKYRKIHVCPLVSSGGISDCGGPIVVNPIIGIPATSTYSNSTYGVSFNYPSTWTKQEGNSSTFMGSTSFDSNATSLATVYIPDTFSKNSNFSDAYLNLSVNNQINVSQCSPLVSQAGSNLSTTTIGGISFQHSSYGGAAAGHDSSNDYYTGYANGTCYEFHLGLDTANGAENVVYLSNTDIANINSALKNVLNTTTFTITPPTTTIGAISITSPNGGEQWAEGSTHTISWTDSTPRPMYVCALNSTGCVNSQQQYTISMKQYPATNISSDLVVANNVTGNSYNWVVGQPASLMISPVETGQYTLKVCKTDTSVCSTSNSFNVVNTTTSNIVSAPSLTLTPTTVNPLSYGTDMLLGTLTVSAGNAGDIALAKIPLSVVYTGSSGATLSNGTSIKLTDINDVALPNLTVNCSNVSPVNTCVQSWSSGNHYRISAGTSKTFEIRANVSGTLVNPGALTFNIIDNYGNFSWDDIRGNNLGLGVTQAAKYPASNSFTVNLTTPSCTAGGYDSSTGFICGCTSTSGYSSVDGSSCSPVTTTSTISQVQGLVATPSGNSVNLSWSPATASNGIGAYNIYRSTTAGFTPGSINLIAQGNVLTYNDANLASGTYYYKVALQDYKGTIGPASSQAVAVVGLNIIVSPVGPEPYRGGISY